MGTDRDTEWPTERHAGLHWVAPGVVRTGPPGLTRPVARVTPPGRGRVGDGALVGYSPGTSHATGVPAIALAAVQRRLSCPAGVPSGHARPRRLGPDRLRSPSAPAGATARRRPTASPARPSPSRWATASTSTSSRTRRPGTAGSSPQPAGAAAGARRQRLPARRQPARCGRGAALRVPGRGRRERDVDVQLPAPLGAGCGPRQHGDVPGHRAP